MIELVLAGLSRFANDLLLKVEASNGSKLASSGPLLITSIAFY